MLVDGEDDKYAGEQHDAYNEIGCKIAHVKSHATYLALRTHSWGKKGSMLHCVRIAYWCITVAHKDNICAHDFTAYARYRETERAAYKTAHNEWIVVRRYLRSKKLPYRQRYGTQVAQRMKPNKDR